jgi:hypothetical protein
MSNGLFVFGRLAHDSQSVLAAIHRLAFVGIELCPDFRVYLILRWLVRFELRITAFADGDGWSGRFYDSPGRKVQLAPK